MAENLLGAYLRARRAQISPESLGIATLGHRRVPGLRWEELATIAGMSVDYYVRLEQGHERRPSTQVLDALAEAPPGYLRVTDKTSGQALRSY